MASKGDHPLYSPPIHVELRGEGNVPRWFETFHKMFIPEGLEISLKPIVVNLAEDLRLV